MPLSISCPLAHWHYLELHGSVSNTDIDQLTNYLQNLATQWHLHQQAATLILDASNLSWATPNQIATLSIVLNQLQEQTPAAVSQCAVVAQSFLTRQLLQLMLQLFTPHCPLFVVDSCQELTRVLAPPDNI